MNKLHSITVFFCSHVTRISLSPSYVSLLGIRPNFRQCPNKVLISASPLVHARGITSESGSALEEKYKQIDKIPNSFRLIYRSPMNIYIPFTQSICSSSMFLILLGCGYTFFMTNVSTINTEFMVFGSLLVMLNVSALNLVSQCVMRIYVSDESYICVMPTLVPVMSSKLKYSVGDVKHVPPKGFLPWRYNRYKIHSQSAIILEHYFRKPADYNTMLSGCIDG